MRVCGRSHTHKKMSAPRSFDRNELYTVHLSGKEFRGVRGALLQRVRTPRLGRELCLDEFFAGCGDQATRWAALELVLELLGLVVAASSADPLFGEQPIPKFEELKQRRAAPDGEPAFALVNRWTERARRAGFRGDEQAQREYAAAMLACDALELEPVAREQADVAGALILETHRAKGIKLFIDALFTRDVDVTIEAFRQR